jgi:hypothetical protein
LAVKAARITDFELLPFFIGLVLYRASCYFSAGSLFYSGSDRLSIAGHDGRIEDVRHP